MRMQAERDELAAQLDAASAQLADLNRRLRESTEAEVVLRVDMVAMRKQLHEERRSVTVLAYLPQAPIAALLLTLVRMPGGGRTSITRPNSWKSGLKSRTACAASRAWKWRSCCQN